LAGILHALAPYGVKSIGELRGRTDVLVYLE
jgi:hypothetical protein